MNDTIIYPSEEKKRERYELFDKKGCGYWIAEENKPNCSFPKCFCYPTWRP